MAALTATCPHQHQPTSVHVSNDPTGTGCQCHVPTTDKNCDCRCVILRFCPAACVRSHGLQRRRWIQSWCNVLRTDTVYHQHVHTREFIFGLFVNWINSRRLNKRIIDYSNSRLWIFRCIVGFSFVVVYFIWTLMSCLVQIITWWSLLFTHPAVTEEHWLNAVCVTWCMWTCSSCEASTVKLWNLNNNLINIMKLRGAVGNYLHHQTFIMSSSSYIQIVFCALLI